LAIPIKEIMVDRIGVAICFKEVFEGNFWVYDTGWKLMGAQDHIDRCHDRKFLSSNLHEFF
jgi:hypothetical protein